MLKRWMMGCCLAGALWACAGCVSNQPEVIEAQPVGESTVGAVKEPAWEEVEAALAGAMLPGAAAKCEWTVLGGQPREVYVWFLCLTDVSGPATGVSAPAAIYLETDGVIQKVLVPGNGSDYSEDVRKIFPEEVQAKIFEPTFDESAAEERLTQRWENPALPPAIVEQTGHPLPLPE